MFCVFSIARIFDTVPETKFDCKDQATGGYYADVDEGRCQVHLHHCIHGNHIYVNFKT